jgi:hypothetical protein
VDVKITCFLSSSFALFRSEGVLFLPSDPFPAPRDFGLFVCCLGNCALETCGVITLLLLLANGARVGKLSAPRFRAVEEGEPLGELDDASSSGRLCLFFFFPCGSPRVLPMFAKVTNRLGKKGGGGREEEEEKKKNLIACRGSGRVVGPLLAARALPLRCAASTMLSSALLAI